MNNDYVYFEIMTRNDGVERLVNVLSMNGYKTYVTDHPEYFDKKVVVVDPEKKELPNMFKKQIVEREERKNEDNNR